MTAISRPNGTVRTLQYDSADQLTRIEERKADNSLILYYSFQYDDAGRIIEEFAGPLPQSYTPQTYTATYDDDNRLANFNGNPVFHDNDGNMTVGPLLTDTLKTYSYDARNRLTAIDGTIYEYDAEGNRISSTNASGTTSYAIDPNTGLSKLLVRTKPDGSKTYYVYGMGLVYEVDESENTLSYHYDYRGSSRFLTDDGADVTDSVEYSPYGLVTHRTGTTDTPFLYNGAFGVMAESNGLYHMRARFYNPYTRRFVNPDPIGFAGGMNWYAFGNGNPVIIVDPTGNFGLVGGGVGAGLGAIIGGTTAYFTDNDVWAGAAGGAVTGGLIGSGAGIIAAANLGAGGTILASVGLGAGASAAGDATSQVVENRSNINNVNDVLNSIDPLQTATAAALGAPFGLLGGGSIVARNAVQTSSRAIQGQLNQNLVNISTNLTQQGTSQATVSMVQQSILNGSRQVGINTANAIAISGIGIEVIGSANSVGTNLMINQMFNQGSTLLDLGSTSMEFSSGPK